MSIGCNEPTCLAGAGIIITGALSLFIVFLPLFFGGGWNHNLSLCFVVVVVKRPCQGLLDFKTSISFLDSEAGGHVQDFRFVAAEKVLQRLEPSFLMEKNCKSRLKMASQGILNITPSGAKSKHLEK